MCQGPEVRVSEEAHDGREVGPVLRHAEHLVVHALQQGGAVQALQERLELGPDLGLVRDVGVAARVGDIVRQVPVLPAARAGLLGFTREAEVVAGSLVLHRGPEGGLDLSRVPVEILREVADLALDEVVVVG